MSILIEIGATVAGMLSEYAQKKRWGGIKLFFVPFAVFFAIAIIASFFYKTAIGLKMEIFYAFCFGLFMGSMFLMLFWLARNKNTAKPQIKHKQK